MKKRLFTLTLAITMLIGSSMTTFAAPRPMPDGTVFDAEFYAETYPDVKAALGTDEATLYNHYVTYGKAEGRLPYAGASVSKAAEKSSTHPQAFDVNGNVIFTFPASNEFVSNALAKHNYYTGISFEYIEQCEVIAMQIAHEILSDPTYATDLQKVNRAAEIVRTYCDNTTYGKDNFKYYRSPMGLYSNTYYTCAGATRTLGRILDYMGYEWTHVNENKERHQWCILTLDGQTGWADGMAGFAGYGELKNGMTMPNGAIASFPE